MGILGPFPESNRKDSYILVVVDLFTRWMDGYAIPNQEANTVVSVLVDEVFMYYAIHKQLHSDQGSQFQSQLMSELCKLLGIKKSRTAHYHSLM